MNHERLVAAATALYNAGIWFCQAIPPKEQAALWQELRDAAGIPEGTATRLGVASPSPNSDASVEGAL